MLRRGVGLAMALAVALLVAPAQAQDKRQRVEFAGTGGQTAGLEVGPHAADLAFPVFGHPRLSGPDGTMSGVLIQRGSEVVGGAVLLNAPGFDDAIMLPIGRFEGAHLAPGHYRVTILGDTRQRLTGFVTRGALRSVTFRGGAHPITRTYSSNGAPLDTWSHRLGALRAGDTLVLGRGAGGAIEAHAAQSCLQRGDVAPTGPCLHGASETFAGPDGASWSGSMQTLSGDEGPYVYSGQIEAAGVDVTAGHVAMVITPRP